ncbi:sodium/potassium/calcium exchanger 4-like isoform X1 [Anneissia japonica]|uniref:sodium/potassium/calcium exchanger 4-like isoform X1 n=1 Tax=Anneissia japonica TaxID=1529436 RepID=UPI00142587E4|nr:sodium/potassium/calcium exchanger 4-like isoform X1 [Anneissia japonica]
MAAGSSAPELFTSIAGVSVDSDVGIGTVVGSAVFNILIIIALTAALAGKVLALDWRPLIRDSTFYGISVVLFIGFSWDGVFEIWEAIILLVMYGLYIAIMKFNGSLMKLMDKLTCTYCRHPEVSPIDADLATAAVVEAQPPKEESVTILPAKISALPPLDNRDSTMSGASLSVPSSHNKHIFHHIKHGELSSNFTSSQYDLRKAVEISERPSTANNNQLKVDTFGNTNGTIVIKSSSSNSLELKRNYKSNGADEDIDLESLAGLSQHGYGSQTHLIVPVSRGDADSGIHSAQGPTPNPYTTELSSDPSENSNSKTKRHSLVLTAHVLPIAHSQAPSQDAPSEHKMEDEEPKLTPCPCLPSINMYYPDKDVFNERCGCMFYVLKWLMFIVSFPFMCLFTWTIPPCSEEHNRKWYLVSFFMSIFWIAVLSFAMVTLVAKTGCILEVDHYTMGLVVVAVGTSVPDALSSILVARDGFGDMAVSNAIGSNVFDINLGLGLPFLIKIIIDKGEALQLLSDTEMAMYQNNEMVITPHAKFGFALLLILFITLVVFFSVRFRLNKVVGFSFVMMYILFMVYAFIQELVCDYDC